LRGSGEGEERAGSRSRRRLHVWSAEAGESLDTPGVTPRFPMLIGSHQSKARPVPARSDHGVIGWKSRERNSFVEVLFSGTL
jgi:hypothetical protein